MDDERDMSILWWPIRVISAFRVHLILAAVLGSVWCSAWARSMDSHWKGDHLMLPPLVELHVKTADVPPNDGAVAPASDAPAAHVANEPTQSVKKLARKAHAYDPMATIRDAAD